MNLIILKNNILVYVNLNPFLFTRYIFKKWKKKFIIIFTFYRSFHIKVQFERFDQTQPRFNSKFGLSFLNWNLI